MASSKRQFVAHRVHALVACRAESLRSQALTFDVECSSWREPTRHRSRRAPQAALAAQRQRRWLDQMPERFTKWCPAGVNEEPVSLLSLHDDPHGLVVRVEVAGRTIEIAFGIVVAFKSTLEESCIAFWPKFLGARPTPGPFWTVDESEWLASFSEADLIHYPGARHYMIVTDDERIDIITSRAPVARVAT